MQSEPEFGRENAEGRKMYNTTVTGTSSQVTLEIFANECISPCISQSEPFPDKQTISAH